MTSLITKFDRLALLLIVILGVVLFLVWARFPEYKSFGQGDPYLDANQYLPGKNFAERGFFREHFLAEYATGPEECYPLWYTHNPSLSEIISGLYYRAGLHEISQQRIIAIIWNLLGAWFFYLLLKRLAGPPIALISLAVFISNPLYIAWGDNLFTNHQWCFAFAGMYFFLRAIGPAKYIPPTACSAGLQSCLPRAGLKSCTTKDLEPENIVKKSSSAGLASGLSVILPGPRKTPPTARLPVSRNTHLYLGLASLCFFLLCYSNYEYVPFVAIFFVGVKVLKIRKVPWSRILILLGAGLAAIIIHQLCVIWAIGLNYWLLDKTETFIHRTGMGMTPLMEIYKKIPILMWQEQARFHGNYSLLTYWKFFYLHLESLFGYGWSVLLVAVCIFSSWLLPGRAEERKKLLRIILLFFIMSIFWFVVFVQHTADHQWGSTILLFAPFAALLYGVVLNGLYSNFIDEKTIDTDITRKRSSGYGITVIAVIIILLGGLIFGRISSFRPFAAYPGIEALKKYRGSHFFTSSIPTVVAACTGLPTGWTRPVHPKLIFSHTRYLINPGCDRDFKPRFFFSPHHPENPNFAPQIDAWLSPHFEIKEKGEDYTIYDLKKPLQASKAELTSRSRYYQIRNILSQARMAVLPEQGKRHRYTQPAAVSPGELNLSDRIARNILEITGLTSSATSQSDAGPTCVRPASKNFFTPSYRLNASSSINKTRGVANLSDNYPGVYWHISLDRLGEPAWVSIDLGEGREEIVNFIRTRPRRSNRNQHFKTSVIQGSQSGRGWEDIAAIIEEKIPPNDNWRGWFFKNNTPYRFYRLLIIDGHERDHAFYSMGALEMYYVQEIESQ